MDGKNANNGLEGITYNKNKKHYFIVNEKNPCLVIEYDKNLNELRRKKIPFAKDLSGICIDEKKNELWLISDESNTLFNCDLNLILKEKYKVNIKQIEGVAVNPDSKEIYVVSDKEEKLFILKKKMKRNNLNLTIEKILNELKKKGSAKNRLGMARFGINTEKAYGVSVTTLRSIAKEIGKNHSLAKKLWDTEIHEARILASMIEEFQKVSNAQMDRWVKDF